MDRKIYIGASYYPEHWPRERWPEDVRLMKEAGIDVLRMAELAWTFLEPEDGRFDFQWLDEFISMAGKEGIQVILGTPTEVAPTWLNHKYPEIISTDMHGKTSGGRGNHCYNSAVLMRYVEGLVDRMAAHYASNPAVIGWQIDNELRVPKCYCAQCAKKFREWLKDRYGSLEELNRQWGTCFWSQVYSSWEEVTLPSSSNLIVSVSQIMDHYRFASDSAVAYAKRQAAMIKKHAPHQFTTHNSLELCEKLDIFKLFEALDVAGWDSYPYIDGDNFKTCMSHDLVRGTKGRNFWVLEQKNGYVNYHSCNKAIDPGLVRLWAYQDIARGADGVVFYRWRSNRYSYEQNPNGLLRHDGSPRRAYFEVKQLTEELKDFGKALYGTKVMSPAAILYSFDQEWDIFSNRQYKNLDYKKVLMSYYRAITGMGLTADLVSPSADLSGYKLVAAPCLALVDAATAEKLEKYVRSGGYLILGIRSGIKTMSGTMVDIPWPGLLSGLAGVCVDEFEVLPDEDSTTLHYKEKEYVVGQWLEMLEVKTASSLAVYGSKFYAGRTAISKNRYGNGTVVYVGVMGNDGLIADIMADVFKECGLPAVKLPEGVFVTHRADAACCYTFIINMNREPVKVHVDKPGINIIGKEYVSGDVSVKGLDLLIIRSEV